MTVSQPAFLVVRESRTTHAYGHVTTWADYHFQPLTGADEGPVWVPEAVFLERPAAEQDRARRERAARELLNPFWLGDIEVVTSLSEADFGARAAALGLPPPPPAPNTYEHAHLVDWWDANRDDWTAEHRALVWDLLDKVRLFEVIETELE